MGRFMHLRAIANCAHRYAPLALGERLGGVPGAIFVLAVAMSVFMGMSAAVLMTGFLLTLAVVQFTASVSWAIPMTMALVSLGIIIGRPQWLHRYFPTPQGRVGDTQLTLQTRLVKSQAASLAIRAFTSPCDYMVLMAMPPYGIYFISKGIADTIHFLENLSLLGQYQNGHVSPLNIHDEAHIGEIASHLRNSALSFFELYKNAMVKVSNGEPLEYDEGSDRLEKWSTLCSDFNYYPALFKLAVFREITEGNLSTHPLHPETFSRARQIWNQWTETEKVSFRAIVEQFVQAEIIAPSDVRNTVVNPDEKVLLPLQLEMLNSMRLLQGGMATDRTYLMSFENLEPPQLS